MITFEILGLPENLTLIPELLTTANNFTDGALGLVILIIVGFGSFFLTSSYNDNDSLIVSTFITMIASIFLYFLNLLSPFLLWMMVIGFVIALIIGKVKSRPGA